jgi:hypothetical protein
MAKSVKCGVCKRNSRHYEFLTEVNPEGGYDRPQFLVCDDCMKTAQLDDWRAEHWPNWPQPHNQIH